MNKQQSSKTNIHSYVLIIIKEKKKLENWSPYSLLHRFMTWEEIY